MKIESLIYNYKSKIDIDFKPNLAFLFFEGDEVEVVIECYKELLSLNPDMEIIGVNGKNGNINNKIPFITQTKQISLFLFKCDYFFVRIWKVLELDKLKDEFIKCYNFYDKAASIIFFPFEYDTNNFLDYIQDDKNMHNIYGGVYSKTNQIGCFYNGKFYDNKLISVFFDQEYLEFFSVAIHGWKPIGIDFKVTKSYKNIVYELDDREALKVVEDYIGEIKQENIDSFLHPFCVKHKNDISLASIKSINRENNSIEFFKYIYEGEIIKITIPINQKQMMDLIEDKLKNIKCDGLFMFSCIGRYAYYNNLLEFEIAKISDYLKVPFAGFLTFGEIGSNKINEKSILQNQTMNLIFFKAKKC